MSYLLQEITDGNQMYIQGKNTKCSLGTQNKGVNMEYINQIQSAVKQWLIT